MAWHGTAWQLFVPLAVIQRDLRGSLLNDFFNWLEVRCAGEAGLLACSPGNSYSFGSTSRASSPRPSSPRRRPTRPRRGTPATPRRARRAWTTTARPVRGRTSSRRCGCAEAGLLTSNAVGSHSYASYLTGKLANTGFPPDEFHEVKTWNSGYPKESEKGVDDCGKSGLQRKVIQNDGHSQQDPVTDSYDMGDTGRVLIRGCAQDGHRRFEVQLFSNPPGSFNSKEDSPIRHLRSPFYWDDGEDQGVPEEESSRSRCTGTCGPCNSMKYPKAQDLTSKGYVYTIGWHTSKQPLQESPAVHYMPLDLHCKWARCASTDPMDLNAGWLEGLTDLDTECMNVHDPIADHLTSLGIGKALNSRSSTMTSSGTPWSSEACGALRRAQCMDVDGVLPRRHRPACHTRISDVCSAMAKRG